MSIAYDEALERGGWNGAQKFYLLVAMLIALTDGFDTQLLGISAPAIMADWNVGRPELAVVIAGSTFGSIVGAFGAGWLAVKFGVKRSLLCMIAFNFIGNFASSSSLDMSHLVAARFACGVGLGGILVCIAGLVGEITPAARRPVALALCGLCMPLGGVVAGLVAEHVLGQMGWRTLFLVGGIVPLLSLPIAMIGLPESPFFLSQRPSATARLGRTLSRLGLPADVGFALRQKARGGFARGLTQLFDRGWRRDTLALWIGYFCCILSVFCVLSWLPTLFVREGHSLGEGARALAAASGGALFGSILSAVLLRLLGSRLILTVFPALSAVLALALMQMFATHAPMSVVVASVAAMSFCFSMSQTTFYALIGSVYDDTRRLTGNSAAYGLGRIGGLASAFAGAHAIDAGAQGFYGLLAILELAIVAAMLTLSRHTHPGRREATADV